jgi:hypothetical protein
MSTYTRGLCTSCRTPVPSCIRREYRPYKLIYPDHCEKCAPLPKVSVIKDGARFLWSRVPPELNSYGTGNSWMVRVADGERARDLVPHGFAPTEEQALADAARVIGEPVAIARHDQAGNRIRKEYLQERKEERLKRSAVRNKGKSRSNTVEYLYQVNADWDEYTGEWTESRTKHRITKRTKTRIYFMLDGEDEGGRVWCTRGDPGETTYVTIEALEAPSERYVPHAWCNKVYASLFTEQHAQEFFEFRRRIRDRQEELNRAWRDQHQQARGGDRRERPTDSDEFTVVQCRSEMQKAHPDRGGTAEEFHLWRMRFEAAKARESQS